VFTSQVIEYEGSQWKLSVYPNGSTKNTNYLSVFVELLYNPDDIKQYDIIIELVHPKDLKKNIVKERQTLFESCESWGYGKLIKNEDL
jgi:hypothetical protein